MNTRRSFFKQLALGIATLSTPTIFIPKLIEPVRWKPSINDMRLTGQEFRDHELLVHNYESFQCSFVPSFHDFWIEYLKTTNTSGVVC